jgi:NAD(P)-dependent dehydrogenase (short-subunit alcohol dehydrogenase family)
MQELRGKTAVVGAAGSGIGRALAIALAAEGMNVALLDIRREPIEELHTQITAHGGKIGAYQVDVGDRASVRRLAEAVERDLGDVDLLCSNVGVIFTGKPIEETPDEMFDWMMNVNVAGTFNIIKAFVPKMRRRGKGGHVTVTSSAAGLHVIWDQQFGAYAAAKMAVIGLGEDLRDKLAADGIGVSVIAPGRVFTNAALSGMQRPERFGGPFAREDLPRLVDAMDPADAAKIIIRGIRDNAPYIFTRLGDRANVERRFTGMLADFDRWERVIPELQLGPTRTDPL